MGSPLAGTSGSTFEIVCNSSPSSHARLTPMFGCGAQLNLMGVSIWEYVLLYCDYVLVISENGAAALRNEIGKSFELMEESIEPPSIYLGGKMSKVTLNNGVEAWSFSSSQYVQAAVKNVEEYLAKEGRKLPRRAASPFTANYRPETDTSSEL